MINQIIPKEIISEGIGEIYYLLPIPFIALVLMASIWLGIINLDGTKLRLYKIYNVLIAFAFVAVAHIFIPVDDRKVNDIPTLIISVVASGLFVEIFIYWRKKKSK